MRTAIHWFRRDLRITDNTALKACSSFADRVIPVYIASEWQSSHRWTGPHRQQFLCGSLEALDQNLRAIGGRLIIRQGGAVAELESLVRETKAEAIFFNRDPDPFGREVEKEVFRLTDTHGIQVVDCKDVCIHERDEVMTNSGGPFRVFTPYARAWDKLPRPETTGKIRSLVVPRDVESKPLPRLDSWGLSPSGEILESGERAARARMKEFVGSRLASYGRERDFPAEEATSRLSQDLRYGLLSIRELFQKCEEAAGALPAAGRASAQKYLGELIWREFYMQVLWHFPDVLEHEFNPVFRGMPWPGKEEHLKRWREGETGFPLVDAAMRQLNQTGFMHNRARMIVAMFLTKDLHLDWRLGESYFMQQLTDGEIASNNGGWQWSAGTGADAAPYFRIQNPWTQTKRYDSEGEYVRRWVPELRDVATEKFFAPPGDGKPLARGYPAPIVDHSAAREETLKLYGRQKRKAQASPEPCSC